LCATCPFLRVTDLGEATFIYLRYSPWEVAGLKHRQLARQVGDLAEDLMANSTASIFIKPTVAFNCGDTFVFGSWVCTADGTGSFQRHLTMTPDPKTGLVTLPEVVTGNLAGKFGEISLYNQHADFELGSASNSNSTSPWAIVCESATQPSRSDSPLHEHFSYGPCNVSRAHAKALTTRRAGKEIVSEYNSDSNTVPGHNSDSNPFSVYYSDSSYEFDFGSDPDEPESKNNTAEQPLSGPTSGLVITSTPAGRIVYWPDRKHADLTDENSRCVAYLDSPSRREHRGLSRGAYSNRGGDFRFQSRQPRSPSLYGCWRDAGTLRDTSWPISRGYLSIQAVCQRTRR
jgi:hypothetical protein